MLWHSGLDFASAILCIKADLKKPWTAAHSSQATCRWDAVTARSPSARPRTSLLVQGDMGRAFMGAPADSQRFLLCCLGDFVLAYVFFFLM